MTRNATIIGWMWMMRNRGRHTVRVRPASTRSMSVRAITKTTATATAAKEEEENRNIRLSKRMSELDICSRREADRLIVDGLVKINGRIAVVGEKVPPETSANDVEIIIGDKDQDDDDRPISTSNAMTTILHNKDAQPLHRIHSIVLNKPAGYVSGQAEHGHPSSIRLLTRENNYCYKIDSQRRYRHRNGEYPTDDDSLFLPPPNFPWKGYAPAGRLDLDSTGLLVFTNNGVLAKKLLQGGSIDKEYIVHVVPAIQPTKRELRLDPEFRLPPPTIDLSALVKGGETLLEEEIFHRTTGMHKKGPRPPTSTRTRRSTPLKPCHAEWVDGLAGSLGRRKMRIVLREGKKNQIKRMCRELIGWHVEHIHRIRIGPISINIGGADGDDNDILPEGCWRPLTQDEIDTIISSSS